MRHQKPYRKLSRQRSHYTALMRNLALGLFEHERIRTTLTKAKESRRFIEKIITLGKRNTLQARRQAFALMGNKTLKGTGTGKGQRIDIVGKVFKEISVRFKNRQGGYVRIVRLGTRPGDAAPMAYLELVDAKVKTKAPKKTKESEKEGSEKAA